MSLTTDWANGARIPVGARLTIDSPRHRVEAPLLVRCSKPCSTCRRSNNCTFKEVLQH